MPLGTIKLERTLTILERVSILDKLLREDLFEVGTFVQRPELKEGAKHANIWRKGILD